MKNARFQYTRMGETEPYDLRNQRASGCARANLTAAAAHRLLDHMSAAIVTLSDRLAEDRARAGATRHMTTARLDTLDQVAPNVVAEVLLTLEQSARDPSGAGWHEETAREIAEYV